VHGTAADDRASARSGAKIRKCHSDRHKTFSHLDISAGVIFPRVLHYAQTQNMTLTSTSLTAFS
jgi:hypothetical protein